MKKLLILYTLILGLTACSICKPVLPPSTDTTVVHIVDSIAWHDSTVYHIVPKEVYNDYTSLLDTLRLTTTYSEFESYIDTTCHLLKGTAKNTIDKVPVEIKWKEKIVYKDSIKIEKTPYPVEVPKEVIKYPKTYWWFMSFTILILVLIGVRIYLKLKF